MMVMAGITREVFTYGNVPLVEVNHLSENKLLKEPEEHEESVPLNQ